MLSCSESEIRDLFEAALLISELENDFQNFIGTVSPVFSPSLSSCFVLLNHPDVTVMVDWA